MAVGHTQEPRGDQEESGKAGGKKGMTSGIKTNFNLAQSSSHPALPTSTYILIPFYVACGVSPALNIEDKWINIMIMIRGLPYMMSAVGGGRGVPKKQAKETQSVDL